MWELQPKTLYTFLSATEKTIKDKPAAVQAFVTANIEATRIMYTDKAKIMPILVKHTGYPEKILSETFDFLVKNCIWDANSGLGPERFNFTANLMAKVGNIKEGKTPKYEDIVDTTFAKEGDRAARRMERPGLPDGGLLGRLQSRTGAALRWRRRALKSRQRREGKTTMSVAHQVHTGALADGATGGAAAAEEDAVVGPAGAVSLRLRRADPDRLANRRALHQSDLLHLSDRRSRSPSTTLTVSGELPYFLGQSLEVMVYGLSIAILVGIPLAMAMARIRWLDWALDLPINALYATPWSRVVPLLVLWFGIYLKAKIIVVFLFAVFPVLINTYQGVRECDKNMLEVARSFRSNEWRVWQDVLLPFAVPYIIAGIRLAIGRGLIGMIIAEFYTTISGLGFMITRYANMFEMDKTFVPVIVLMVLGVSLTTVLKWVGRRIAPWSHANR